MLDRLSTYKLYINLKKCQFHTDNVEFLGFIIDPTGIRMDPSRVATVAEWPEPTTFRDVQVFLGFSNFYRRFITAYSRVAQGLMDLLKGSKNGRKPGPFEMTPAATAAFTELKRRFDQAPLLRHFDVTLRILVETDASDFAIAGILSQLFGEGSEARWCPIAFFSRKLSLIEFRYETHDKELLAIVATFEHWGQYLRGAQAPVIVRTDHDNLRYFMTKRRLNGRQSRWAQNLAKYDFYIKYKPDKNNPADGPSRRPDYRQDENEISGQYLPGLYFQLSAT